MNELPRETLCYLIKLHGRSLIDDPGRCEGLLRDFCGIYKREISVLMRALRGQVAHDLLASSDGVPRELLLTRLTGHLQDDLALQPDAAKWAVETWALALGRISSHPPPSSAQLYLSMPAINFVDVTVNSGIEKRLIDYENDAPNSLRASITTDATDFLEVKPTTLVEKAGQIEVNLDTGRVGWGESYSHSIIITYNGPDSPMKIPVTIKVSDRPRFFKQPVSAKTAMLLICSILFPWIGFVSYLSITPQGFLDTPALTSLSRRCSGNRSIITLRWAAVEKATEYEIYRNGESYKIVEAKWTTFENYLLDSGQKFTYQVRATRGNVRSNLSNALTGVALTCK